MFLYFMGLCICIYVFLFVMVCIMYYLMATGSANSSTCQSSRSGGNHSVITAVTPGLCTPALEEGGVVALYLVHCTGGIMRKILCGDIVKDMAMV